MSIVGSRITVTIVVLLVLVGTFAVLQFLQSQYPTAVIQIGEKKVYVQVAKTLGQQERGLGGRQQLLPYGGMIFPHYPARRIGIVMRDMEFAIDIIWMRGGIVVDIAPDIQPQKDLEDHELPVYYPRTDADLVLEASAGFAQKYGIRIGDTVMVIDE